MEQPGEHIEVVVGRLGKPHGLRGELTVELRTDEPERRFEVGATLRVEAPRVEAPDGSAFAPRTLTVAATRWHQGVLLATFEEVDDRTGAERARGVLLHTSVDPGERPEDPEEFYDHQLVGLAVHDESGAVIGEVVGLTHGAQDLLSIRATDGRAVLVPFVTALVPEVALDAGRVVVADRPGLVAPWPDES